LWIKIKFLESSDGSIIVPKGFFKDEPSSCKIAFGHKALDALVSYTQDQFEDNSSFEVPITLQFPKEFKEKLLIYDSLVYRANIDKDTMQIGPIIGFLLGVHNDIYSSRHMKKYSDRLGIYNKIGGLIYAFSPNSADLEEKIVFGLYYNFSNSKWEFGKFPMADVIYRRDFHQPNKLIDKLIDVTDNKLFNSHRFSKLDLYDFVKKEKSLCESLPETIKIDNFNSLKDFLDKNIKVILKPVNLSRGRGICIIEKMDENYEINDYRSKKPKKTFIDNKSLKGFFNENQGFFDKYLVQKYINLARIDDSLFDIRVVMQKNITGQWESSGIECRVSRPQTFITNIARGGYALNLDEALRISFGENCDVQELTNKIIDYCTKLCSYLDNMGNHLAELGLDIALDVEKKLWLIEANVFPSFHGFKKIDFDTYLKIRYNPLLYALSLML